MIRLDGRGDDSSWRAAGRIGAKGPGRRCGDGSAPVVWCVAHFFTHGACYGAVGLAKAVLCPRMVPGWMSRRLRR